VREDEAPGHLCSEEIIMDDITPFALSAEEANQIDVFTGYVSFNDHRIPVDFEAPAGASGQLTDSAFVKALGQVQGVALDYFCVGTREDAEEAFPEDIWDLDLAEVFAVCRWTLEAFAVQLLTRVRRRGRALFQVASRARGRIR
jgi:hypothetical protein